MSRQNVNRFKTQLCMHWQERGVCEFGSRCLFAHGESDRRPMQPAASAPPPPAGTEGRSSRPVLYRTKLCQVWVRTGSCPLGPACRFAHGSGELVRRVRSRRRGNGGYYGGGPGGDESYSGSDSPPLPAQAGGQPPPGVVLPPGQQQPRQLLPEHYHQHQHQHYQQQHQQQQQQQQQQSQQMGPFSHPNQAMQYASQFAMPPPLMPQAGYPAAPAVQRVPFLPPESYGRQAPFAPAYPAQPSAQPDKGQSLSQPPAHLLGPLLSGLSAAPGGRPVGAADAGPGASGVGAISLGQSGLFAPGPGPGAVEPGPSRLPSVSGLRAATPALAGRALLAEANAARKLHLLRLIHSFDEAGQVFTNEGDVQGMVTSFAEAGDSRMQLAHLLALEEEYGEVAAHYSAALRDIRRAQYPSEELYGGALGDESAAPGEEPYLAFVSSLALDRAHSIVSMLETRLARAVAESEDSVDLLTGAGPGNPWGQVRDGSSHRVRVIRALLDDLSRFDSSLLLIAAR